MTDFDDTGSVCSDFSLPADCAYGLYSDVADSDEEEQGVLCDIAQEIARTLEEARDEEEGCVSPVRAPSPRATYSSCSSRSSSRSPSPLIRRSVSRSPEPKMANYPAANCKTADERAPRPSSETIRAPITTRLSMPGVSPAFFTENLRSRGRGRGGRSGPVSSTFNNSQQSGSRGSGPQNGSRGSGPQGGSRGSGPQGGSRGSGPQRRGNKRPAPSRRSPPAHKRPRTNSSSPTRARRERSPPRKVARHDSPSRGARHDSPPRKVVRHNSPSRGARRERSPLHRERRNPRPSFQEQLKSQFEDLLTTARQSHISAEVLGKDLSRRSWPPKDNAKSIVETVAYLQEVLGYMGLKPPVTTQYGYGYTPAGYATTYGAAGYYGATTSSYGAAILPAEAASTDPVPMDS